MADNGVKILEFDINKFVSLVDLQYAEYWTSTYGYDYSDPSNKKKQDIPSAGFRMQVPGQTSRS